MQIIRIGSKFINKEYIRSFTVSVFQNEWKAYYIHLSWTYSDGKFSYISSDDFSGELTEESRASVESQLREYVREKMVAKYNQLNHKSAFIDFVEMEDKLKKAIKSK